MESPPLPSLQVEIVGAPSVQPAWTVASAKDHQLESRLEALEHENAELRAHTNELLLGAVADRRFVRSGFIYLLGLCVLLFGFGALCVCYYKEDGQKATEESMSMMRTVP